MSKFLLLIYKILSIVLLPLVILIIFFRIFQNKEINTRIKERFAFPSVKKPKGKIIWINASSIGEYLATISLIKKSEKLNRKQKYYLLQILRHLHCSQKKLQIKIFSINLRLKIIH